ncbi:MAG: hypothetical protein Q9179_005593 [Wetmoreana sp. 5 TL-2023]
MAVSQLPAGNKPVTWYNTYEADVDPKYTLPIVRTRALLGSCQIQIQMSGKYSQAGNRVKIRAPPDHLRLAAQLTVQRCVAGQQQGGERTGGYSTYDFAKVIDWITAPQDVEAQTYFPTPELNLPASITFFTAMVWNYGPRFPEVEPGSEDEHTAIEIARRLASAAGRAPAGKALQRDLENRQEYVEASAMEIRKHGGK